MRIVCPQCGNEAEKPAGAVNRARNIGAPVYCDRICCGLARRRPKTIEQKKAEKAEYDSYYRAINYRKLKRQKAAHFARTYDPAKAAVERKARTPRHVEYCRRPEYKKWKRGYDLRYRAERVYDEYADAFLLLRDIDIEVNSRMSDYEVRVANGTLNKRQQRKRAYARVISGRA